jgi:hypothetical protein
MRFLPWCFRPAVACGALVLLACAGGCSGVRTVYSPHVNLNRYRTYAWVTPPPGSIEERFDRTATGRRIHAAVAADLAARGLHPVATVPCDAPPPADCASIPCPDLLVAYRVSETDELASDWDYGPGPVTGARDVYSYSSKGSGTLLLDFIDPNSRHVVWRSAARGILQDPDSDNPNVESAIGKMLANYPPGVRG